MAVPIKCTWSGVFPAATTQFDTALEVDIPATQRVQKALLQDGVHGLVLMGTVGEGNSLTAEEKRRVLGAAVEVSEGKVPVIAGVSEFTTAAAATFARDAERIGAAGLMVLPAMVYVPTASELEHHFRTVAASTGLPIMLYNNPPSYRVNIDIPTLTRLADVPNIVSIKESAPDSRRFTDIINAFAERFVLFAGLDDIAFEAVTLGDPGPDQIRVQLEHILAVLEQVARAHGFRRELPGPARRDEPALGCRGDRGAENEPARLGAEDDIGLLFAHPSGERVDRLLQRLSVREKRRDVLEADPGCREVRDFADLCFQIDHEDATSRTSRQRSSAVSSCASSASA